MQSSDLVSIVIPTYNRVELLIETVDSVLAQTYENWECILVDDGSTDESLLQIIEFSQKDPRIKLFQRIHFNLPKGANACRNIGIEKADGEYIIFFDSDDLFLPNCLYDRVLLFQQNLEYDFIVFQVQSFSPLDSTIKNLQTKKKENYLEAFLSHSLPWSTMGPMLKTSFVKKFDKFDLEMPRLQDPDYYTTLLLQDNIKYKVLHDNSPDCLYRANDSVPNFSNGLFGFYLYLKKYLSTSSKVIGEERLKACLRECYIKSYKFYKIFYRSATSKDQNLMFKLTIMVYNGDLISTKEVIVRVFKIFYFSSFQKLNFLKQYRS